MPLDRLLDRLERSQRLDRYSEKIAPPMRKVLARPGLRGALSGRWLGHPAHPALILMPLGCWVGASVLDVVGGRRLAPAARRLVGLGLLTAVPAAAAGASDWLDTSGAERRVGTVHAATNAAAMTLFSASWWLRRNHRVLGALTGLLGASAAGAGGYLGGHLTYRRGVGVDPGAFRTGPRDWEPVMAVDDLPHHGLAGTVTRTGAVVCLARVNGVVHALDNRCTHRGGPLHQGRLEGDAVVCPWHGSTFALTDGSVRTAPASIPQPVYEVRVRHGQVEIRRDEPGGLRTDPADAEQSVRADDNP